MGITIVSKTPALWKTFLVFLAPLMLSNALQSLFGTVSNALLGQMIGVDALAAVSVCFPRDVLPVRLRHGPKHRRNRPDRTGMGRGRTRQGEGCCRRDAGGRPRPRHHGGAMRRPVQPAIDDRARHAAGYPRPGQRLCARHAADDAARLRLPADDRDAAGRRRHADAADGAGLVDRDRPGPDATPHPRRVRIFPPPA